MHVILRISLCFAAAAAMIWGTAAWIAEAAPLAGQFSRYPAPKEKQPGEEEPVRLPSGKLQRDVILKHEHEKNLDDLKEIQKLTSELIEDLEAQSEFVFSVANLKKMEEMEKLSKQVKSRFKKH